jgi:alpha-mannosidase
LRHAWELVCLNQFHDIIPGSSISLVYLESQQQYAEVQSIASDVRDAALDAIAKRVKGDVLIVNPTSFARRDLAFWPGGTGDVQTADGTAVLVQPVDGGVLVDVGEVTPFSVTPLVASPPSALRTPHSAIRNLVATATLLENDLLRVELNEAGDIIHVYDRVNARQVLPAGAVADQFQAFEDRPKQWDAWDLDIFYDDKMWLADPASSVRVVEAGPLRATLEIRRRILHSDYVHRISLAHNSPRLDFHTTIDWRERHILLKVAFPVDILSPVATYEIQWGNVQRPTHRNTSWDWARFETVAQKWVDLSEGGYGVSLLNDCKYGHDIQGNVMRISLLRGTTMPDPEADQGEHRFAYSLLSHAGEWGEATIGAAYALNDPLIMYPTKDRFARRTTERALFVLQSGHSSFISMDRPNIIIETIKRAEDGHGLIVRFYESQRRRGPVTLTAGFDLEQVWRANLLEENQAELTPTGKSVSLFVKPYEIVTLRLVPVQG